MDNIVYKKSVTKITIVSVFLSLVCAVVIIVAGSLYYYNLVILSLSETASVAALQTAGFVDSETLERAIFEECDESWLELQLMFDLILNASRDVLYLYIMVAYDDERFMYIVSGNIWEARGYIESPDVYGPAAWHTLRTGEVAATTSPVDAGEWGIVIASYAPLRNYAGDVIAVLGADIDVAAVYLQVFEFAIVLGVMCILLLFAMSYVLRRVILSILRNFTSKLMEAEHHRNISMKKDESKTRFLAKMSHEIRTPMNVILGLTELQLQKEMSSFSTGVRGTFSQIYRSSKLLLGIINDILDYSKVELGKMEIVQASYDLYNVIVSSLQMNMIYLGEKHVNFEVNVDKSQYIELVGDSLRIRQILNNILSNALKYTIEGSVTFTISYEELQESDDIILVFVVKDTGLGMSQEQVALLYSNEYVRFASDASSNVEGTGLGIAISYQLVALMGGSLDVESELGAGTTFTFKVRQKKHTDERLGAFRAKKLKVLDYDTDILENISQIDYLSLSHGSVLVVDDILSNLVVIKEMLSMYGIQVDTANCGRDAIHLVSRRKPYDIIFMDYMMPGMNGMEVMLKLREMGYDKPIIMLTADVTNDNEQLFINSGFDDFLSKPVDIHELDNCLKRYIPEINEVKKENVNYSDVLIKSFLTDAERETKYLSELMLDEIFDEKKFEDFRISVHGLKSACVNVGLMELSELALRLELASKDRDQGVIIAQTPIFLAKLRDAAGEFSKTRLPLNEVSHSSIDVEFFTKMLLQLADESEAYNAEELKRILKQMEAMDSSAQIKDFLTEIRQMLLHSDFEAIGNNARNFAKGL